MDTSISIEELTEVMASLGMSTEDAASYREVIEANLSVAQSSEDIPLPVLKVPDIPRPPSRRNPSDLGANRW